MPRVKTIVPTIPSREKGQRSLDDLYIHRIVPAWARPYWQQAEFWRAIVKQLPVAIDCREHLISYMTSLEWKIEPRDSSMRDELKEDVRYHTELFESGGDYERSGWDFIKMLEHVLQDDLDTPFGGAGETIREGDKPDGRVLQIIPLDSATLYPIPNKAWPVVQMIKSNPTNKVVFPAHAINRLYMSPRNEITLEGWGMAPPEKIFLALEMLRRGDFYYWKFLSDTPEAGVLDLMDVTWQDAEEWIKSCKDLFTGVENMKIPVLAEHTIPAKFISFGKDPNAIQFDGSYHRYTALVCSGYGITTTDIGFPGVGGGSGATLAGGIRDERRTRRSGIARLKSSTRYWFNRMLPKTLQFIWIDLDDETAVSKSRARLAGATAASQYIESRVFSPKEMRLQTIADGLMTISVPEDVPEEDFKLVEDKQANERPGMLGAPVNPAQGGQGEVLNRGAFDELLLSVLDISDTQIRKLAKAVIPGMKTETDKVFDELQLNELDWWVKWHNDALWGNLQEEIPELTLSTIQYSDKVIKRIVSGEKWMSVQTQDVTQAVHEFVKAFRIFRENHITHKSVLDYENGKSKTYFKEVEPDEGMEKKFMSLIRGEIRQFLSDLDISKPVIAGVRNAIIQVGLLDNSSEISDNVYVLTNVRKELANFYQKKLGEFYSIVEQKSKQYLEENLNG